MEGMYAKFTALCMCIHETFCRESIAPFAKITLFALQIGRSSSYTLTYITKHFMLVLRIFNIAIVHKEISDFFRILYCIIYQKLKVKPSVILILTTFIEEHIICIFYFRLLNHDIN